jgi:OOP family OmpA-OmpF porin
MRARFRCAIFTAAGLSIAGSLAAFAQTVPAQGDPSRREYTLFFDFGSAQLGPLSKRIVEDAATAIKQRKAEGSLSHVKVIGYSDTAGSMAVAQRLSEQRASAVRDELVRLGLPQDAIGVEGRGKKELAVPTGDRVSEPRNRRARVVIFAPGE